MLKSDVKLKFQRKMAFTCIFTLIIKQRFFMCDVVINILKIIHFTYFPCFRNVQWAARCRGQ